MTETLPFLPASVQTTDCGFLLYTGNMTEAEAKNQLVAEGYLNVSAWLDSPDFSYPEHAHSTATAHIIVAGQMTLTMDGVDHDLQPGDRIEVPISLPHVATMGPAGCTYVTGEK